MDVTIQNKKLEAKFKNGKYFHTFTPKSPDEVVKIHHEGCVGDTRLTHIQLEQGNDFSYFVEPTHKVNSLSGIFKNLRDLDVQLRDQTSDLWSKIKLNNKGMLTEFYNQNIETKFTAMAGTVNAAVKTLENNVVKKSDVTITPNSISLGAGKTIDGNTVASLMKLQPDSIKLISPLISVTGDMIVDGTLTSNKFAANSVKAGHIDAGAIEAYHLKTGAFEAEFAKMSRATIEKLLTNTALITELFAQQAFINNLKTVKIDATQIDVQNLLRAYVGEIGGFRIGHNPNDGGRWLTGANNFDAGINPGDNAGSRGAQLWAAWGNDWRKPGPNAWTVNAQGVMSCSKQAIFYDGALISGNLRYHSGTYTYSPNIKKISYNENSSSKWVYFHVGSSSNKDDAHTTYWASVTQSSSDRRYKSNIKPTAVSGLETINNLKCYEYDQKLSNGSERHIKCGIMAQDVKELATDAHSVLPDGRERYEPFEFIPYLIKAIQELSEENKQIKREMEILKNAG